ncbi:hypothetical protein HDU96_010494 [Phlyctochytrium bullatum]|nr:hypothetical protein HDU96_010494 [Phlyctochytrium bullatum]
MIPTTQPPTTTRRRATATAAVLLAALAVLVTAVRAQDNPVYFNNSARCFKEPEAGRLEDWNRTGKGPLVLEYYSWDSGNLYNAIMRILALEVLSYPVQMSVTKPPPGADLYNWTGLISGSVHASFDVWVSTDRRRTYLKTNAQTSARTLESAGANGQAAEGGWYISKWAVDAWPAMASYRGLQSEDMAQHFAFNATTISRIPPPLLPQPSTNRTAWIPSGRNAVILTVSPAYSSDSNPVLSRNLGLKTSVQYSGDPDTYTMEVWRALTGMGVPTIVSLWTPHQMFAEYKFKKDYRYRMTKLFLPEYDPTECGTGDNVTCGFEPIFPQKILSTSLLTFSEELYWLAKQLTLSNDEINLALGDITFDNMTVDQAACKWITTNKDTWGQWLWFRKCDGGCGNGYCRFGVCECKEGWDGKNCDVERIYYYVKWNSPLSIGLLTVSSVLLLSTVTLIVTFFVHSEAEVVKAHGWIFNIMILASLILAFMSPFFAVDEPTIFKCNAKIWLPCLSLVTILSTIIIRNYRLVYIFSTKTKGTRSGHVSDFRLLLYIVPFLFMEVALLSLLSRSGRPTVKGVWDASAARYLRICDFENLRTLTPGLIIYKSLMVACAVFLAYKTRNVPDKFGESNAIAMATYNITVLAVSFILVLFIVKVDDTIWFLIYCLAVLGVGSVIEYFFFARIVYYIIHKDRYMMDTLVRNTTESMPTTNMGALKSVFEQRPLVADSRPTGESAIESGPVMSVPLPKLR